LRPEQDQNNQQDDDQIRPCQIHEAGDKAHALDFNIKPFPKLSRQIVEGGLYAGRLTGSSYCGKRVCYRCVLLGKAALASGWFIFRWRFIQPRAKRRLVFDSFAPAILALSDTRKWRRRTQRKFRPTKS